MSLELVIICASIVTDSLLYKSKEFMDVLLTSHVCFKTSIYLE